MGKKVILKIMRKKNAGMSIVEILLVFTVIMVMTVGVFNLYRAVQSSQKKSATQTLLLQVQNGIENFKNDLGRYPAKLEEFASGPSDAQERRRWSDSYIDKKLVVDGVIRDAYGNEIVYEYDKSKNKFEVYSWGPNGVGSETGQIQIL